MDRITLQQIEEDGVLLDVTDLLRYLERVEDKRSRRGKRFPLPYILTLVILAKLAGKNKPSAIAEWVSLRREVLVRLFQFKRKEVPSLNTIRRTLETTCEAADVQKVLLQFLHQKHGGQQSVLVAIDGKTVRGTIPKGKTRGTHLLAAYLPAEGIVLFQVGVDAKENEITAAPRILEAIDLKGRIVCGDAMFTQRALSVIVLAQGGDYIWIVKKNQEKLQADIERFFEPVAQRPGWHRPQMPHEQVRTVKKAHQRLEERTVTVIPDTHGYLQWPGARHVFRVERRATCLTTGKIHEETAFGVTSLADERASAAQLSRHIQAYWGIENGLHYRRDVTLEEDATRMSLPNMPEMMATLNNFVIGLVNNLGFSNLASAQRLFDASILKALAHHF